MLNVMLCFINDETTSWDGMGEKCVDLTNFENSMTLVKQSSGRCNAAPPQPAPTRFSLGPREAEAARPL